MNDEDNFPTVSFNDVVAEIETHDAANLIMFDRNSVNGYVTFKFYGTGGQLEGKLTFDEVTEDMAHRAKAVLDHLSTTTKAVLFQDEVQNIWDNADPPSPAF